ncbi:fasciclin domain-containing protein [Rubrivivax rivuli]|uniref:Fasciclin domain-containing protein n=1 Tax=Rubrivivax rivuli TaxID=1862385 RepID=A0A437RHI6_9BURK|nr:fasciclin domain-containing protein [Rubrivivax rivuli]RVU46191.1 fasciclin domain-containing protein [Rubrivivax rivuli]
MTLIRRTWLLAPAALALAAMVGCASTPAPATVAETAARTPQLSTLTKLIADAGLTDTLKGSGPFTVFAPSDEAFKAVPAKTMAELAANKELLRSVLTYHVVAGKVMAADVKTGNLKSVQGANLGVAKAGDFVTVEDAVVTQADVGATNGVVHVIDKVMMPPRR